MTQAGRLGRITGMMEKEALGTKLVAAVMSRANRAGKFAGKTGIARRDKFVKSLQNWLWGHHKRVQSQLDRAISASPTLPYSQLSRTSWKSIGGDELSSALYQPHKKVFNELHKGFSKGQPAYRAGGFKPPKINLQSDKELAEHWFGPSYSWDPAGPKWQGWVYGGRQIPTLLHEMGHAYTVGPRIGLMPKIRNQLMGGGSGFSSLFPEVQANRAAIRAIRNLGGQGTIKNLPTTKQYYDFARTQYDVARSKALQDFLQGKIVGSDVPAWIKRMGLPVRRGRSSARGYKRYLAGRRASDNAEKFPFLR